MAAHGDSTVYGLKHPPTTKSVDSWTIQKLAPAVQIVGKDRRGVIRKGKREVAPPHKIIHAADLSPFPGKARNLL